MKKLFILMSSFLFAVGAVTMVSPRPANAAPVSTVEYGTFSSPSLGKDVSYAVSLPPSYKTEPKRRYPLVIFLHGMFNSEKDWEGRGIQAALDQLRGSGKVGEYIVAVPRGENSFYINSKAGVRYEDAIVKDFIPFIDKTYRTTGSPKQRLIEGISMGGYGALNIAFKYPEMFTGVATHCAAIFIEPPGPPKSPDDRLGVWRYDMAKSLYGDPPDAAFFKANNPLDLAQANVAKIKKLKIYFDVGSEDRYKFDVGNKRLDAVLTEAGIKHEFHLVPGNHGWAFLVAQSEPGFTFCWNAVK